MTLMAASRVKLILNGSTTGMSKVRTMSKVTMSKYSVAVSQAILQQWYFVR